MQVDCALIANNASVLVSEFSRFGTLIDVCNKYKSVTSRNVDEYVVMVIISQILAIIDHLHAMKIIHADIKPDNFLLMEPLEYDMKRPAVQLIDFGISIDMETLPQGITFRMVSWCPFTVLESPSLDL